MIKAENPEYSKIMDALAKDVYFRLDLRTKEGKRAHARAFFVYTVKD